MSQSNNELRFRAMALVIRCFLRYKARLEARRRAAWVIYQSIEYSSEASQTKLQAFLNELVRLGSRRLQSGLENRINPKSEIKMEESLLSKTAYENIEVESTYSGPRLTFPLNVAQIKALTGYFSNGGVLHPRYLLQLLHEIRRYLKTRPNISSASTSISKQITVVGDLYGKIEDLLTVFDKNGLPDIKNPYVFNGNMVDRGANSVEVAALLFACQLVWPTAVYINRGNHEDHLLNNCYGFIKEVQKKYQQEAKKIVPLFAEVFAWLPLATVIDKRTLVVHGGVSDTLDLEKLESLDRHMFLSVIKPQAPLGGKVDKLEWKQVTDLIWSDPRPQSGCEKNTRRGAGCFFGPDVTEGFLRRSKLQMLIRSHECCEGGFEYFHNGTALTLFSASNYHSEGSNLGAYANLDSQGKPHIVQFSASKSLLLPLGRRLAAFEDSALRSLRAKITAYKSELITGFAKCDPDLSGCVSVATWCNIMESHLKLKLPWRALRPQLAVLASNGLVMYMSTFQRATLINETGLTNSKTGASMAESLYKNKEELETIFRMIDQDNTGKVSLEDFKECCGLLSQITQRDLSDSDISDMAIAMDMNNDGYIDFNEFLEAFRIVQFQEK